ncbi:MAG: Adrenodoxin, mitochondrial [Marteilia pararefringens]
MATILSRLNHQTFGSRNCKNDSSTSSSAGADLSPITQNSFERDKRLKIDFRDRNNEIIRSDQIYLNKFIGNKDSDARRCANLYEAIDSEFPDLDGFGLCLGQMACTTCMVKFDTKNDFDAINMENPISNEEIDLLETSEFYEEDKSRLCCQLKLSEKFIKTAKKINIPGSEF